MKNPLFRAVAAGGCGAPSRKSAGDALVASWISGFPDGVKNATRAPLPPFGDEASPLLAPGNFGVRIQSAFDQGREGSLAVFFPARPMTRRSNRRRMDRLNQSLINM
jgi:hypothetical protein